MLLAVSMSHPFPAIQGSEGERITSKHHLPLDPGTGAVDGAKLPHSMGGAEGAEEADRRDGGGGLDGRTPGEGLRQSKAFIEEMEKKDQTTGRDKHKEE